jgi:hypothetical protein
MAIELEFLDGIGAEGIANNIEAYDGHIPCIGDLVYLETHGERKPFRVVDRAFYFVLTDAKRKISLHCVPFDKERDSFTR